MTYQLAKAQQRRADVDLLATLGVDVAPLTDAEIREAGKPPGVSVLATLSLALANVARRQWCHIVPHLELDNDVARLGFLVFVPGKIDALNLSHAHTP